MTKKLGSQKTNILITGGLGFIGRHLVKKFKPSEIRVWDLQNHCDIFDPELEKYIKTCEIVYHLAALTSVELSFKDPQQVFMTNVLGTARIAYLCAKYKKKLVYPSSAAIYHRELSPYAESKAQAEDIVKGIMDKTPVVILRLYNVFGPGMNKNSGSIMYNFMTDKRIVVYGDGEQTRDFVHVEDVASIMKEAGSSKWNGKIVDVGTGEYYTINYVAGLFAYYRKKEIEYEPPRREIKWSVADVVVLAELYKKNLKTNLKKNIKELCQN